MSAILHFDVPERGHMTPLEKMRTVMTTIAAAPADMSFATIIEEERKAFKGMHVVYATHFHDSYVQQVRMDQIEAECALVCGLFDGSGLLFYSDRIYRDMQRGPAQIMLDFSIGFDKNVCDNIRRYVEGRGIDRPDDLRQLLHMIRGRQDRGFNYDFFAYLVEEYEHFFVPNNDRPGNTMFALKVLDHIDEATIARFPASPLTPSIRATALRAAQETLSWFFANDLLSGLQLDQRKIYVILLKGLQLKWQGWSTSQALGELAGFSLQTLGKLAKREIYFAWKMMGGDGMIYPFFQPVLSPSAKSLNQLKGMSWDLTMLRWAETMSGVQRTSSAGTADFFIPFVASNDRRFREMVIACPLKAIIIDRHHKIMNLVYRDELIYQITLHEQMEEAGIGLGSVADQERRLRAPLNKGRIENAIVELEIEARVFLDQAAGCSA
jgi:hypothetical protein